ncbi:shikimate kinase [Bradyrhizobium sp. DASA03007]|uniref:shikimate kinase n=1 Tax=unclassified Bradyrhizobium TaxID=2631580 RepID=UPI003F6FBCF7
MASSISEIWRRVRSFRCSSAASGASLAATHWRLVLATGGGAFMSEKIRDCIREKGVSIWINTDLDTITKRLARDRTRPLLQTGDAKEAIKEMMRERAAVYQMAHLSVEPTDRKINKSADELLSKLHEKLTGGTASQPA